MTQEISAQLLEPGRNCWRIEPASRLSVIVDAEDYFHAAREAMMKARKQIMLIGWDFDARIVMTRKDPPDHPEAPSEVGDFISWLIRRNPDLDVYILRWNFGSMKTLFRGKTLRTMIKWQFNKRIHLKRDSVHPIGASHHQKIVVIDDSIAFAGGIDMTVGRWDTRAHPDGKDVRINPGGDAYMPWHDATTAIEGKAAQALGDLCRDRWVRAGADPIAAPDAEHECWPDSLVPHFHDINVAVARTQPESSDEAAIQEIEKLYIDLIADAKRHIYAESQYFASRKIAEAIAKRLDEPDGPEIVILNPIAADGWLEQQAMDTARAHLFQTLHHHDKHGRLRMFHPVTTEGDDIYVHAKILIIDDQWLRVGSSNFNNRSLGLDTECDVVVHADEPHEAEQIIAIRHDLMAEHLGTTVDIVEKVMAESGSLIATIDALRRPGRGHGRTLIDYEVPDLNAVEEWLADNQILDSGDESVFEAMNKGGLLRRLHGWRRKP